MTVILSDAGVDHVQQGGVLDGSSDPLLIINLLIDLLLCAVGPLSHEDAELEPLLQVRQLVLQLYS